jgi:hypothetical protein
MFAVQHAARVEIDRELVERVRRQAAEAGLLGDYRMASLGTLLTLWAALGASFGALCERANRKGAGG